MGEHLVAAVAVLDLDVMAVGRASDPTVRWAVDSAAGRPFDGLAGQTPHGAWAAQNGVDGLAGLEMAQQGLFPVVVGPAPMAYCLALGVVVGISTTAKAKGTLEAMETVEALEAIGAGDTRRAGEVV